VLDGISRLKNKGSLTIAGSKQRLPFVCFLWFEEVLTFPHNLALVCVLYFGERPEITPHDEESEKAKTSKTESTKEQKMKLKTEILAIALGLAASTSLVWSADRPLRETTPTIQGVWQVARTGVNCDDPNQQLVGPFPAIMTFHRDGTMTADTGALEGSTSEYGSWQREPGSQNYSFRELSLSTDENGALAIRGTITANVHLTDANSFTYSATIQIFDADGNLIATFCGRSTGTRFE
jgi:hypothetical protein